VTDQLILNQLNPTHIAQAVSQHLQQQTQNNIFQSCDYQGESFDAHNILQANKLQARLADTHGASQSEGKQDAMQVNPSPRVDNEPAEYMAKSPFSQDRRAGSENIDVSVVGNTPSKPGLDASATKDKQLRFLQQMQQSADLLGRADQDEGSQEREVMLVDK